MAPELTAPAPPDHSQLRDADPYAFQVAHRRLAWLLRLSVMTNVVLVATVLVLVSAFNALLPMKEIRVALLRADPADDRVYQVQPLSQEVDGFDLLMEAKARRFVKLLVPIDNATQTDRLREAFAMMGKGFYDRFHRERVQSGEIEKAVEAGQTREVVLETASLLSVRGDIHNYTVDFQQIDRQSGQEVSRRHLRAYLRMTSAPNRVREAEKYSNPLGIRVLDMTLRNKESAT